MGLDITILTLQMRTLISFDVRFQGLAVKTVLPAVVSHDLLAVGMTESHILEEFPLRSLRKNSSGSS